MSDTEKYKTVRIPWELSAEIDGVIGTRGFRSRAEVVKDREIGLVSDISGVRHINL